MAGEVQIKAAPPPQTAPPMWDRQLIAIVLGLVIAMVVGYHSVGWGVNIARARPLMTPWDQAVPFVPESVLAYSMVYSCALYPLFVVRSRALFVAVTQAYTWLMALSYLLFVACPVSSAALRPPIDGLDLTRFSHWGVRLIYFADPPTNCFPSMHLSFAVLSLLSAYSARRMWGWVAAPIVTAIAVSILTMKQHYIADGVGGLALAVALWRWLVVPTARDLAAHGVTLAATWRGPVAYAGLAAAIYAGFYGAFAAGWRPWAT